MQNSQITKTVALLIGFSSTLASLMAGGISTLSYDTPSYLEVENATVAKDGTNVVVTVMRSGDFRNVTAVDYATQDGTAIANDDYKPVGGRLVFQGGEGVKTITIPIIRDTLGDETEAFQVVLSNPAATGVITRDTATITITGTQPPPRILVQANGHGGIVLAWPSSRTDCVLEKSDSPASSVWTVVGSAPVIVGDQCTYTEPASDSKFFYRLRVQ